MYTLSLAFDVRIATAIMRKIDKRIDKRYVGGRAEWTVGAIEAVCRVDRQPTEKRRGDSDSGEYFLHL
jgi:hypothetical protein